MTNSDIRLDEVRQMAPGQLSGYLNQYRPHLKTMVRFRLHPHLKGRIDGSDVVQEALLDAMQKLSQQEHHPCISLYGWLRRLTWLKLAELHRLHLGTLKRSAHIELSFHEGLLPSVDSQVLAASLHGDGAATAADIAMSKEKHSVLHMALDAMEAMDRELIVMKHFECLSISELADALDIPRSTVGHRYLRAIRRLRVQLQRMAGPDFFGT